MMWELENGGDLCIGCFPASLTDWLACWLVAWLIGWFAVLCLSSGGRGFVVPPFERRGEDEEAVSGCLLMVRSVVSSTDSGLSPVTPGPLHITGHNSTHLAV